MFIKAIFEKRFFVLYILNDKEKKKGVMNYYEKSGRKGGSLAVLEDPRTLNNKH